MSLYISFRKFFWLKFCSCTKITFRMSAHKESIERNIYVDSTSPRNDIFELLSPHFLWVIVFKQKLHSEFPGRLLSLFWLTPNFKIDKPTLNYLGLSCKQETIYLSKIYYSNFSSWIHWFHLLSSNKVCQLVFPAFTCKV